MKLNVKKDLCPRCCQKKDEKWHKLYAKIKKMEMFLLSKGERNSKHFVKSWLTFSEVQNWVSKHVSKDKQLKSFCKTFQLRIIMIKDGLKDTPIVSEANKASTLWVVVA